MSLVSVIVTTFNRSFFLVEAINSILAQTHTNIELIIVDDGSNDNTKEAVQAFLEKDMRVQYIYQSNSGVSVARNTGINHAKGEFIAFCDDDDLWLPKKLEKQLPLFRDSDVVLVYTDLDYIDENRNIKPKSINIPIVRGYCFGQILMRNVVAPSSTVVRADILDKFHLFDPRLRYCEDKHFNAKLARKGKFDIVTEPLTIYRIHSGKASSMEAEMLAADLFCVNDLLKTYHPTNEAEEMDYRRAFRYIYSHYATNLFYIENYKLARKCFANTLRYGFAIKEMIYLLVCSLPSPIISTLKHNFSNPFRMKGKINKKSGMV